jgi:AcrR family transcriptional regulator
MITPARNIRNLIAHLPGAQHPLTPAQQDRQDFILEAGRLAITEFGFETITLPQFSVALRLTPSQIRWHYPDLENLLGAIFRDHIKTIGKAIEESVRDPNDPALHEAARAAYFAATRTAQGSFTEAHRLFLRDRRCLPADEAKTIDLYLGMLARALGGAEALNLLNTETHSLADIETAMAALTGVAPAAAIPQPEPAAPSCEAPRLPRHIRRKIEALRRQRQKQGTT